MDTNQIDEEIITEAEMDKIEKTTEGSNFSIYNPFRVDALKTSEHEGDWNNYLDKIIHLSESSQDILISINTVNFFIEVSEDFNLSNEQSAELSRIIRDVLLGDMFINDMIVTIINKLKIDQTTAQQIRDKIVKELFAPAIEDIKKIQREKFPDRIGQGSANTMSQPPAPPQMKNALPVNQSNVIDLRNNTQS